MRPASWRLPGPPFEKNCPAGRRPGETVPARERIEVRWSVWLCAEVRAFTGSTGKAELKFVAVRFLNIGKSCLSVGESRLIGFGSKA